MMKSRNGLELYEVGADKPAGSGVGGPQLSGGGFGGSGGAQIPGGGGTSEMTFGPTGSVITLTPGAGVSSLGAGAEGQAKAAEALWGGGRRSDTGIPLAPPGTGIVLTPGAGVKALGPGAEGQRAALDALQGITRSSTGLPVASPSAPSEPITTDKLDKIRELGQMVEDGSIRRVRTIIRKGGALGRLARELLR